MRETLLSGASRSLFTMTPFSPALPLRLPEQNSHVGGDSVASLPFSWALSYAGLKSFHPCRCHSRFCCGNMAIVANSKANTGKGKQTRSLFVFSSVRIPVFHTRLAIVISVSHGLFEEVCWQHVFSALPQTKVQYRRWLCCQAINPCMKIWSWRSWKCLRSAAFFLFSFYSTLTFIISKSKAREEEEEEEGELGHTTKATDRQKMGGNQTMDALQCSAAWSEGEHAYNRHRGNLFFVHAALSQLRSLNCLIDLWSDLKAEAALNFDYKEEKCSQKTENIYTRKLREKDIWRKAEMVKCAARNF